MSDTDTNTSSDSGHEEIDMSDLAGLGHQEASELVFLQYRKARRRWRRLAQKPVRKFRRYDKRMSFGKGWNRKGGGKRSFGYGRGRSSFLTSEAGLAYLKGKG